MKTEKILKWFIAGVSLAWLAGCGPNVEKCTALAVEKSFKSEGIVVKCPEVYNLREVESLPNCYTGKVLVKQNGAHMIYDVKVEMVGDRALVEVLKGSRKNLN